jgi:hypothetical protein
MVSPFIGEHLPFHAHVCSLHLERSYFQYFLKGPNTILLGLVDPSFTKGVTKNS